MPPRKRRDERSRTATNRRRYLRGLGAAFALGATSGEALAKPDEKQTPKPYGAKGPQGPTFESDAYFTHISELPSVKEQLGEYEKTGEPHHLQTADLMRQLDGASGRTIDITVSTCGERSEIRSRGQFGRLLHGWRPAEEEVAELAKYGDVIFAPEVVSTKVGLANVPVDDLSKIAALDFVLEIGYDAKVKPQSQDLNASSTGVETSSTDYPTADDLKTWEHYSFDSETFDLTSFTQVGVFGSGYTSETDWGKRWAADIGIDTGKAKDFVNNDWRDGGKHGTTVTDTATYMLKDGDLHSDLMVPLKVYDPSNDDIYASDWRAALDYAVTNDIPIGSSSVETHHNVSTCPSTLCAELESYANAGYMTTCATGNDALETEVCHPASSYYNIAVGGYHGSCSGGYSRAGDSNHGQILYYDSNFNTTYCSWCKAAAGDWAFRPDVYGSYKFYTDDGTRIGGTSFAAPAVAAGGAVHHSVHGDTDYTTHRSKYTGMDYYDVCPSEASELGNVLHVSDLT